MLTPGQKAPAFTAESTKGTIDLSQYLGKSPIVLIFYPKDQTLICTMQLCAVRDSKAQYEAFGALVVGVNPGGMAEHERFAAKYQYDFPLIVDTDLSINRLYDVGKSLLQLGQKRIVYVIGPDGKIAFVRRGNPRTNIILEAIRQTQ